MPNGKPTVGRHDSKMQGFWANQCNWSLATVMPERALKQKQFIEKYFLPKLSPSDTVCDLACACGDFAFVISPHVKLVDGYDLSTKMLDTAKASAKAFGFTNLNFEQANALTFTPTKIYDAYMVLGLFTYILRDEDMMNTINTVYNSLKPEGYLIIKDTLTLDKKDVFFEEKEYAAIYRNINKYMQMYTQAGFELVKTTFLSMPNEKQLCSSIAIFKK